MTSAAPQAQRCQRCRYFLSSSSGSLLSYAFHTAARVPPIITVVICSTPFKMLRLLCTTTLRPIRVL